MVRIITLTMITDWHIGSGAGQAGNIDRLVLRDADSLPFIPAKTLTGIWRDGCEQVALGLDGGRQTGIWHEWVDFLFGSQPALYREPIETVPQPAALSVRVAQLPETLRAALRDKPLLKEALTFIKPGVSIDSRSGCARTDFLRFEEMVRAGGVLEASYSLPDDLKADNLDIAIALLVAGAAFVERLGAKRRRGVGRCKINLRDYNLRDYKLKETLDWIQQNPNPPSPPELSQKPLTLKPTSTLEDDWYCVELIVELKSPLLLYKRKLGNVVETLDYIPGINLLLAISRQLQPHGINISEAIAKGDILATHATLEVEGVKGKPAPFALYSEKLNKQKFYNRLGVSEENKPQLKNVRSGYVADSSSPELVEKIAQTHNTVDDRSQRPTEDVGGVYTYEAIAPGTQFSVKLKDGTPKIIHTNRFRAQLKLRSPFKQELDEKLPKWITYLNGNCRIGRAKKDDYGLASITVDGEPTQIAKIAKSESTSNELIVWLLSDVLLRDNRLRPTANLNDFKSELEKHLEVKLKEREDDQLMSVLARQARIESWQTRWSLPRPSLVGLAAGTCIVYQVENGQIDPSKLAKLAKLEATGIGERRVEGYGQVCFNDPLLLQKEFTASAALQSEPVSGSKLIATDEDTYEYACLIERSAWKEAIRKQALAIAANYGDRQTILGIEINEGKSKPSLSQLGALRSVLAKLNQSEKAAVTSWIQSVRDAEKRQESWGNSLTKLATLVSNSHQIWQYLKWQSSELTLTVGGDENLRNELWSYAVQVLVDACIRAHKREVESRKKIGEVSNV